MEGALGSQVCAEGALSTSAGLGPECRGVGGSGWKLMGISISKHLPCVWDVHDPGHLLHLCQSSAWWRAAAGPGGLGWHTEGGRLPWGAVGAMEGRPVGSRRPHRTFQPWGGGLAKRRGRALRPRVGCSLWGCRLAPHPDSAQDPQSSHRICTWVDEAHSLQVWRPRRSPCGQVWGREILGRRDGGWRWGDLDTVFVAFRGLGTSRAPLGRGGPCGGEHRALGVPARRAWSEAARG